MKQSTGLTITLSRCQNHHLFRNTPSASYIFKNEPKSEKKNKKINDKITICFCLWDKRECKYIQYTTCAQEGFTMQTFATKTEKFQVKTHAMQTEIVTFVMKLFCEVSLSPSRAGDRAFGWR